MQQGSDEISTVLNAIYCTVTVSSNGSVNDNPTKTNTEKFDTYEYEG